MDVKIRVEGGCVGDSVNGEDIIRQGEEVTKSTVPSKVTEVDREEPFLFLTVS